MENSASFAYSEPFTRAGPRKKRRQKPSGEPPQPLEQLERTKKELEYNNVWLSTCHKILQDVLRDLSFAASEVLCLGLGSPVSSRDARVQLAFLIRFCSLCDIDLQNVSVYDPVFTDADSALLRALGMQCLADNRNAKHPVIRPTILYMPHCDMDLYENIIRENWTRDQLSSIIFIANRFSDYIDNNPLSKLETVSPCLLRLAPFLDSRPLPTSECYPTAFNNISVQHVRRPMLPEEDTLWSFRPKQDHNSIAT